MVTLRRCIGANIKQERMARGLTIEEFAKLLGVSAAFIGLIEKGQRGTTVANLLKIAGLFGITLDELVRQSKGKVSREGLARGKREKTLETLISSLDEYELDYIIASIRIFIRYGEGRKKDSKKSPLEADTSVGGKEKTIY